MIFQKQIEFVRSKISGFFSFIKRKKDAFVKFVKEHTKTFIFITATPILFIAGFFVPFKVTWYTTLIEFSLLFSWLHYRQIIKHIHENTFVTVNEYYYRTPLINIWFCYTVLYVFYIYMCLMGKQFL
jgi:hypothetical protein